MSFEDIRDAAIANLPPFLFIPAMIVIATIAWAVEWARRAI